MTREEQYASWNMKCVVVDTRITNEQMIEEITEAKKELLNWHQRCRDLLLFGVRT